MTSEEIKNSKTGLYSSGNEWLKEIAYQLAVMNEREASKAKAVSA